MRPYCNFIALMIWMVFVSVISADSEAPNELTSLPQLLSPWDLNRCAETNQTVTFSNELHRLVFYSGSRRMDFNGTTMWMNGSSYLTNSSWMITEADAMNVVTPLLDVSRLAIPTPPTLVVLDPGHGGEDPGAIHENLKEKDLTLDIAHRTADILRQSNIRVRMTRRRDQYLSLDKRTELATRWGADLFISIHLNKAPNHAALGIESFVVPAVGFPSTSEVRSVSARSLGNQFDAANSLLGMLIQRGVINATSAADRGVKRARYQVLRDCPCPAVLIECGFLSNPVERTKLKQESYRRDLATGLSQGILTYMVMLNTP